MIPKHLMESKLITDEQLEEYQRLKHNWNKLKKMVKHESYVKQKLGSNGMYFEVDDLLNRMQELEKGDVNE